MDSRFQWILIVFMAISALFWPFWITATLFVAGIFFFENFYAGLVILFIMDAVYGFETFKVGPIYGLLTVGGIMTYFLFRFIKDQTMIFKNIF